jgi:hypothetical protein
MITLGKEKEFKGQASAEQIEAWKKQNREIFELRIEKSVCYLKKPDRQTLKAMAAVAAGDPIKSSEIMLENCWIAGDNSIKTDDVKFLAAVAKLSELIEVKQAELKKL